MAKPIKGKALTLAELADFFGVSIPTVNAWIRNGCPFVTKGGKGRAWEFDSAAVATWLKDKAVTDATGQSQADEAELKRRKLEAETTKAELELAKAKGELAPLDQVERMVAKAFAEVRAGMRNLPQRTVSMLIGETDERRFKTKMMAEIDEVLKSLDAASLLDGYDDEATSDEEE